MKTRRNCNFSSEEFPPSIDERSGVADNIRYWRGASGDRYVFTEIDLGEVDAYPETVVMLLDGPHRPGAELAFLGEIDSGCAVQIRRLAAARCSKSVRAFVHLLAKDAESRKLIIDDLAAA